MKKLLNASSKNQTITSTDIDFIKTHFRYPLNSFKKLLPLVLFPVILSIVLALFYISYSLTSIVQKTILLKSFIFSITLLSICISTYKYIRSLFFEKIPTPFSTNDNMALLTNFFLHHHFKYYMLNDRQDIFMMQSNRILNANSNEEKEIVFFIADEKHILLNSHISTSNLLPKSNRKYKELKNY